MKNSAIVFDELVQDRRAVRVFETLGSFDKDVVKRSLERAVLSPNSSNMQLWEFVQVTSPSLKEKMAAACLGQNAAKTASELVVVLVRRDLWKKRCEQVVAQQVAAFKAETDGVLTDKHKRLLKYWEVGIPILHKSGFGCLNILKRITAFFQGFKKATPRQVTSQDMRLSAHRSAAIAAQTFMMSITAEGYDSCPMEGFDSQRVSQILNLPSKAEIAMIIAVGKGSPKGVYGPRLRLPFEEVYRVV
ncbi:MAG: FIG002003: Protein YdjA [uncultured Aureispira sp.]|uniref:FIG002003: Protein YdjA n=1 Tax=uncultured Aureispira sp. TaxID=1331704 RepID=A0A6S6SYI1_9BACT|nr:MAG: FIG002003: Protein YdjA [uncultured Aureispira sp.]